MQDSAVILAPQRRASADAWAQLCRPLVVSTGMAYPGRPAARPPHRPCSGLPDLAEGPASGLKSDYYAGLKERQPRPRKAGA